MRCSRWSINEANRGTNASNPWRVRQVRFRGWQQTVKGERDVYQVIRKRLLKYKLHTDQDLFDRDYGNTVQYC